MKISVVIPVCNGEKYIAACLDCMARQTHRDLELIVVDDGSTDRTAGIAAGYAGVKLISQQNRGQSVARNVGMAAATGDYIHFMDADDLINDRFYELLAAAAAGTGSDAACCEVVNEPKPARNTPVAERRVLETTDEKMRGTNVGRWGYVWRYLFRASFLRERALTFEPGRLVEDMPFSLQAIYFANRVVMTPGAVYTYMLHEGSSMTIRTREHRRRRHRDLRHARELRHRFARRHGFRIPGVPTAWGWLSLLYVKWLT
ncbi:MAG: glycosyltransferase [Alistipes sp.]|jgi:glycosyltransferase involved in cell wall biosynthesis|nr:glycosyltransferase [Alistipes sp.]